MGETAGAGGFCGCGATGEGCATNGALGDGGGATIGGLEDGGGATTEGLEGAGLAMFPS